MGDWIIWLSFAARIIEALLNILGGESRLVMKLEDKLVDMVVARIADPPEKVTDQNELSTIAKS